MSNRGAASRSADRDRPLWAVCRGGLGFAGPVGAQTFCHILQLCRVRGKPARMSLRFEQMGILPNHAEEWAGQSRAQIRGTHVMRGQRGDGTSGDVAVGVHVGKSPASRDTASEGFFVTRRMDDKSAAGSSIPIFDNRFTETDALLGSKHRSFIST